MRFVILIILDGWGIAPAGPYNAVSLAKTPNIDRLCLEYPQTKLLAAGQAVGLPQGEDGNSETGHLNIGAGRIVYQDLARINLAIAEGSFYKKEVFLKVIDHVRKNHSKLHLLGLIGAGGVHSSNEHLFALMHLANEHNIDKVFLHLITDGRDSPPKSALIFIRRVMEEIISIKSGHMSTIIGRYYAMDRDNRWERTKIAYDALVCGIGKKTANVFKAIEEAYQNNQTDEFIKPLIVTKDNKPLGLIEDNDAVIFFNFRIDRPRQLTKAFICEDLQKAAKRVSFDPFAEKYYKTHLISYPKDTLLRTFERSKILRNLFFVTMTEYEKDLSTNVVFPSIKIAGTLGEILSKYGCCQLRVAESEKERFVTYYFNGQNEEPFFREERIIIPSPKVATYDLKPEMSAYETTKVLIDKIEEKKYAFLLINFANPDMVGHSGIVKAAVKACEIVDECVGKIVRITLDNNGSCLITADHGNVEEMYRPEINSVDTEHSALPVPLIIVDKKYKDIAKDLSLGILADIAPSVLDLLNIQKPEEMTGRSLIKELR